MCNALPVTVLREIDTALFMKEFHQCKRLLNPIPKCLLEPYGLHLAQYKTVFTAAYAIAIAAKMLRAQHSDASTLSKMRSSGFFK